jgi:hypothetical protein
MGKASRTKTDIHRRERIAAQRAAELRQQQRNRLLIAGGSILAVVVIVLAVVLVAVNKNNNSNVAGGASNGPTGVALAAVVKDVTTVPASALDQVGAGGASLGKAIKGISGPPLTANGKPEIFYDGAEYCPFCAAARWGMIVALSRFGTFSGLKTVHSSTIDNPPNIPTWTFAGSTYTSKYITFTPVEELTNVPLSSGQGYTPLQAPTKDQQALMRKYNTQGSIPFIDFGNKYVQVGDLTMLGPSNLSGNWAKIASDLKNPSTKNSKAVLAGANFTTAAICKLTNNQPATACTPAVQALESQLNG